MSSKNKNILYISPNGYFGGAEKALIDFAFSHKKYGKYSPLILFFKKGEAYDIAKKKGIEIHHLKSTFKLSNPLQFIRACLEIRNFIKNHNIKFINSCMPYSHIVIFFSTLFLNTKNIWYQHGPVGGLLDKISSLFPVSQIFFNSAYTQKWHEETCLLNEPDLKKSIARYCIYEQQIDKDKVLNIRGTYKKNQDQLLLLQAGRICSWKSYETTLKAISILENDLKCINLLIIGSPKRQEDQKYYKMLQEMVTKLNLKKYVQFIPFVQDIQNYMKASDIFIHTSKTPEPFGLVVAEAMLTNTFVIGSSKGGISDILINNITGKSFDTTVEDSHLLLAKILEDIIKDKELIYKTIDKAKDHIKSNHQPKNTIKQIEKLYDKI